MDLDFKFNGLTMKDPLIIDGRNPTACNNVLMPVGGFVGHQLSVLSIIFVLWDKAQVVNPRPS